MPAGKQVRLYTTAILRLWRVYTVAYIFYKPGFTPFRRGYQSLQKGVSIPSKGSIDPFERQYRPLVKGASAPCQHIAMYQLRYWHVVFKGIAYIMEGHCMYYERLCHVLKKAMPCIKGVCKYFLPLLVVSAYVNARLLISHWRKCYHSKHQSSNVKNYGITCCRYKLYLFATGFMKQKPPSGRYIA